MKLAFSVALAPAWLIAGALGLSAQAPAQQNPALQQQPSQTKPQTNPQTNANPFPENTDSVPVMPTRDSHDLPPATGDESTRELIPVPVDDADPVRSPEDASAAQSSDSSSSSSLSGIGNLAPPDDDTAHPGKRKGKGEQVVPEHHETAAEDENVGSYYIEDKNWKGALSRFQSAMVLDPDNPDVYWGLAESERHLGDFANARANYKKVMEYDPGSRHAKEAGKVLQDPEIANAKPSTPGATPAQ